MHPDPRISLTLSVNTVCTVALGRDGGSPQQGFGAGLFWDGSGSEPTPAPGKREHNFGIFEN